MRVLRLRRKQLKHRKDRKIRLQLNKSVKGLCVFYVFGRILVFFRDADIMRKKQEAAAAKKAAS